MTGDNPAVYSDRDRAQIARIAEEALAERDQNSAIRLLEAYLPQECDGLRNVTLFSNHHLIDRVPTRPDWDELCRTGSQLIPLRKQRLVEKLGFTLETKGPATILRAKGHARTLAVFLDDSENPDTTANRFKGMTPVSWAMASATADNIPYVFVTRGSQLRLYTTRVASADLKGGTSSFLELNLPLLTEQNAGYLPLLFSAENLGAGGELERLLAESQDYATGLGSRLRQRVYELAVPRIAQALITRHEAEGGGTDEAALRSLYERALLVLFRLLFVAYAEDRELLPLHSNGLYRQHSLKYLALELAHLANEHGWARVPFDEYATDFWDRVRAVWSAIDKGRKEWSVPEYNGGMFSSDPEVNEQGEALAVLSLTNSEFGPALLGLLVDADSDEHYGPVDFASLDVREFGTIYEGLLESNLSVAPCDLAIGRNDTWVPAKSKDKVEKREGEVYLHNRSGARKSTGTYFTKPFAVVHLLDHALEPALDNHVARLDALLDEGKEKEAAEAFFDFRCADLAMGSGHFLVAAVDRIERKLSSFLARRKIPSVLAELSRLAEAADKNLKAAGVVGEGADTNALLRRQIAKRCIYGVDLNETAVELARLGLWIHTFVKGIPLTSLNHGLIAGNSLTGIGTLDEAVEILSPGDTSLLRPAIESALDEGRAALKRFSMISEATAAEMAEAQKAYHEAREALVSLHLLFDLAIVRRMDRAEVPFEFGRDSLMQAAAESEAAEIAEELNALHFPAVFPEVFAREDPGFDCIVGNPPWDKVMFQPQAFWVARSPGLNALPPRQREKAIDQLRRHQPTEAALEIEEKAVREQLQVVIEGSYPHRGRGHYDFAKLFVERAHNLLNERATLGYVLPAGSLLVSGWGKLRKLLLCNSNLAVVEARNKSGWLFEDVEFRTAVALLTRSRSGLKDPLVTIWPGVTTKERLESCSIDSSMVLPLSVLETLSDSVVVPWLNDPGEKEIFEAIRRHPSLASGNGWISGRHDARWDFRGSGPHKRFASGTRSQGSWNVLMTRHIVAFGIDKSLAFQQFIHNPLCLRNGVVGGPRGVPVLGTNHPVIVFRHPSRNDDSRTMVATALPSTGYMHNKGYVHAIRHEQSAHPVSILALLGFLNTFTCDWWVRRFVDRHITAPVVNNIRLPSWNGQEIKEAASLTEALLAQCGWSELAGRIHVKRNAELWGLSHMELRARLEHLAARGFNFGKGEMSLLMMDFSEGPSACPSSMRSMVLEGIR